MSAILAMPPNQDQDEIVSLLRKRLEKYAAELDANASERKAIEDRIKRTTDSLNRLIMPFIGKPVHHCIKAVLRDHKKPMDKDELVQEALNLGAAYDAPRTREGDIARSIHKMAEAGTIRISKDGKVSLVE